MCNRDRPGGRRREEGEKEEMEDIEEEVEEEGRGRLGSFSNNLTSIAHLLSSPPSLNPLKEKVHSPSPSDLLLLYS